MSASRSSGLLLHITSLPSRFGIGDLGPSAYHFADFLARTGQTIWQILPLGPSGHAASPYSSPSTHAGNPLLISPDRLVERNLLHADDLRPLPNFPTEHVDFDAVIPYKRTLLEKAFHRFEAEASAEDERRFATFRAQNAYWLDDFALYMALKEAHADAPWTDWADALTHRDASALAHAREEHERAIRRHMFWQYLFDRQWTALRDYGHANNLQFFGDIPIYVAGDSADMWAHQDLFRLDADGYPSVVAGVPPDDFSETGQRWGNPIYRWDRMRERGYAWWTRRFAHVLKRVDLVRIDHFRGFAAYWEIPASHATAEHGTWVEGPGADLFTTLERELGALPVVAEDLGFITEDVTALRDQFGFPGMAVLQFAFGAGPLSDYLPHNYRRNMVAYTGTHDNHTTRGWWTSAELSASARGYAREYLALDDDAHADIHWRCIRVLMASVADRVIFPLQDVLGLGIDARMNDPSDARDNWKWRYPPEALNDDVAERLSTLTQVYGRTTT